MAAVAVTALLLPPQVLVRLATRGPASFVLPQLWHRALCAVLAIDVEQIGQVDPRAGTIFVGNHISHFDIFVLGSRLRAAFIAKSEMEQWPGIKMLGAMQQTLFVSRRARDAARVSRQVADSRRRGLSLILFAEGTTSSGHTVAPFKSSLFSLFVADPTVTSQPSNAHREAADEGALDSQGAAELRLQPFTIELIEVEGQPPRNDRARDLYAFYGGAPAGAHVWRLLRSSGVRVRVTFHPPLAESHGRTRKQLALAAHGVVSAGLSTSPSRCGP